MSCGNCEMCRKGRHCAHVLLLSPKDSSDADRLWRRFRESGTEPGHVDLSKRTTVEAGRRVEPDEHLALVPCSDCRDQVVVLAYIAPIIAAHRLRITCHECHAARRAA